MTRDRTPNPLVYGMTLQPTEPAGQGSFHADGEALEATAGRGVACGRAAWRAASLRKEGTSLHGTRPGGPSPSCSEKVPSAPRLEGARQLLALWSQSQCPRARLLHLPWPLPPTSPIPGSRGRGSHFSNPAPSSPLLPPPWTRGPCGQMALPGLPCRLGQSNDGTNRATHQNCPVPRVSTFPWAPVH